MQTLRVGTRATMALSLTLALLGASGDAIGQEVLRPRERVVTNAQVVVPQSRGFPLDRRADAVLVEAVRAHVTLRGAAATTTLDIALRNPGHARAESVMLLPVPRGAAVSGFDFDGAGAEPSARVLPAAEARRVYDDIVRRARDPALLEFAGQTLVRTSVFPIAAGGVQRLRLTYEHVAPTDGPRVDYLLPRSAALDARVPWAITVDVVGDEKIAAVYSPSHAVKTERVDRRRLRVTVEAAARTEPGAFRLSILRERDGVTGSLFAYPDPATGGGTFLFLGGVPTPEAGDAEPVRRQLTIVLDRSGSMAGAKMDQARAAALQVIEGLADGERFNIVDYATSVARFAPAPVQKTRRAVLDARAYLDALRPQGGTNLHDALVEALHQPVATGSLPLVLFLTDGIPTVGERSEAAIAALVDADAADTDAADAPRVFTFGVGNDVNAPLLDRIADRTRAIATYVRPDQDVELAVDRVYRRLAGPILSAPSLLAIDADGALTTTRVHDVIPAALPDVFDGDHVVVLGRYRGTGALRLRLSGTYAGAARDFDYTFDLARATTSNDFVPRLWAARRIAYLTDEVRQAAAEAPNAAPSAELTNEIVRLSTEFGILTEYTAFLATEGSDLGAWDDLVAACSAQLKTRAVDTRAGASAVAQGVNFNGRKWQSELNGSNRQLDENLNSVSFTAVQQVADRSFFRRGRLWIDGSLAGKDVKQPERVVQYGSDEHLRLLHDLVLENRQAILSMQGDIVIQVNGTMVLVKNPRAEDPDPVNSSDR